MDRIVVAGPAGDGEERRVDARCNCQTLQFGEMLGARAGSAFSIFIFKLHANDRSAILPEQALYLAADLAVEAAHVLQVLRIVAAQDNLLLEQPVGESAIAHLAVIPGTDAQINVESVLIAKLDKMTKIALSCPVELAFDLFMMNPEDVGGDHLHAAGLHLEQFLLPVLFRIAREVKLSHDGQPWFSIEQEAAAVDCQTVPRGRDAAHLEEAGLGRGRLSGCVNQKRRRNLLGRKSGG